MSTRFDEDFGALGLERSVLERHRMRRGICFLMTIAIGCASERTPNPFAATETSEAGGEDDGGPGGELAATAGVAEGDTPTAMPEVEGLGSAADAEVTVPDADSREIVSDDEAAVMTSAMPPFDTTDGGVCTGPPAPGDLVIDELMIESVAGTGDHGEWIEIQSTASCATDLRGVHGEAPSGNNLRIFQVDDDLWIPAYGTFVVADSSNPAINHRLPGPVVVWSGQPGDVLRNKGGTVTLLMNGVVIDSVTYPSTMLTVGATLAFPSDCAPSRRSDWTAWQTSVSSWFPGFRGTPNTPNLDVQCP